MSGVDLGEAPRSRSHGPPLRSRGRIGAHLGTASAVSSVAQGAAWPSMARPGMAGSGAAGHGRQGSAGYGRSWQVRVRLGLAWLGRRNKGGRNLSRSGRSLFKWAGTKLEFDHHDFKYRPDMSARTIEHWYHDELPEGRRDIFLHTDGTRWRVEISKGPLWSGRWYWDCDDEQEAHEIVSWLKAKGGRPEWWRSVPTGYNR